MPARRTRRSAAEARQRILEAAERRLIDGGPEAVRLQPLARDLGITDAAIHHHFGTRDDLLVELLKFGGRRLREAARTATEPVVGGALDVGGFLEEAGKVFGDRGYARLALWLSASGWRERGSGLFDPLAEAIAEAGGHSEPDESARFHAALLVLVSMAEPVFGSAARRSVSLEGDAATAARFRTWLAETLGRSAPRQTFRRSTPVSKNARSK